MEGERETNNRERGHTCRGSESERESEMGNIAFARRERECVCERGCD